VIIAVIAQTSEEAIVVAQNIIHEGHDHVVSFYPNYVETTTDTFICMCPHNLMIRAHRLTVDVVFVTEAAYEATKDDVLLSDTILDLARLGPSMIIVNDDPDLLVE